MLDIIFVTYNSEQWLNDCVASIAASDYDLKQVTLNFCDNASTDGTLRRLNALKAKYETTFGAFRISEQKQNLGFGGGNNQAASLGTGELIFCLNTDTTLYPDTLREIANEVARSDEQVGLWELRQFPYEHPKFYDPLTRETSWSSGACFVMRRSAWEKLGGFDEHIFMYGEDVDLSWRARAEGYKLIYTPKAVVNHYCYRSAGEVKPTQYLYSLINNLYLRCKFGNEADVQAWHTAIEPILAGPEPFPGAHQKLREIEVKEEANRQFALEWHKANAAKLEGKEFHFYGWDYEVIRDGAFFENERPKGNKKVSVIVRTCGRPATLRETLVSLRWQTYPNMEIVVVEDGEARSEAMLKAEFSDLPIVYRATGNKVGRSAAGNLGMTIATGDYLNFLDDDDLFYADHLETLVMELERHPDMKLAFSLAFDTPIRVLSRDPYEYELTIYNGSLKKTFNRLELLHHNLFPIQAVMFHKAVFEELGGLDEHMDALEDWDLWVRYATRYPFHTVWKTTSVYRVPADRSIDSKRQKELDDALATVRKKHEGYTLHWNSRDLLQDYEALFGQQTASAPAAAPAAPVEPHRSLLYRIARKGYHLLRRVFPNV